MDAAGMSLIDRQRPWRPKENGDSDSEEQPRAILDDDSVRIRCITRVLLAHGAKVSPQSIDTIGSHSPENALVYMIEKGCSVLIKELSSKGVAEPSSQLTPRQQYLGRRLMTRIRVPAELLEDDISNYNVEGPSQYQANTDLLNSLIETEDEQGVVVLGSLCSVNTSRRHFPLHSSTARSQRL